jgi:hypothetical protein
VRCVVAFGLVKEVMGWRYFADVASMSFSKKHTGDSRNPEPDGPRTTK